MFCNILHNVESQILCHVGMRSEIFQFCQIQIFSSNLNIVVYNIEKKSIYIQRSDMYRIW